MIYKLRVEESWIRLSMEVAGPQLCLPTCYKEREDASVGKIKLLKYPPVITGALVGV